MINLYSIRRPSRFLFLATLTIALGFLSACSDTTTPVRETRFTLGTTCTISIMGNISSTEMTEVFDYVEELDSLLGRSYGDSEVEKVNKAAGRNPVTVNNIAFEVIQKGLDYSAESSGIFDITIGPLVTLWGIGTDDAKVPTNQEREKAIGLTNYRNLIVSNSEKSVYLSKPEMMLDLGAIAKGYAADLTKSRLLHMGYSSGILDFGGNILLLGAKPDGSDWRIGIQSPDGKRGSYIGIVEISNAAVVTSGIYERYFEDQGKRYHHILDPSTGYPVDNGILSASVITGEAMDADALSTIFFALGVEQGLKYAAKLKENGLELEILYLTKDGKCVVSPGLDNFFTLTDKSFEYQVGISG